MIPISAQTQAGLYLNNDILSEFTYISADGAEPDLPVGGWPYPRIATLTNATGVVPTYLYRQVDNTTFNELSYDFTAGRWSLQV